MSDPVLDHLKHLVAFDTRNPPRDVKGVGALLEYASSFLEASSFTVAQRNLGDGCLWLRAIRGKGGPLINVHIDTVPADAGWPAHGDPHALALVAEGGRVRGLGACDIKGALAALLVAVKNARAHCEVLLTSDEEAGSSTCVRTFAREHADMLKGRAVLVAEPTMCKAVLAHRGIATCAGTFTGTAGHASQARAFNDSATHEAARWAARALEWVAARRTSEATDVRFNLGRIEGGTKANMIASSTVVRFGVRPYRDPVAAIDALCALAPAERVTWEHGYLAPSLIETAGNADVAKRYGFIVSDPVDFFTEAALFAEAGANAVVIGPGDIAQAHTAGEWVTVTQLHDMQAIYERVLAT